MENAFPEDDQYPLQRDKPGHSRSEETTEDLAAVEDVFQKETDYFYRTGLIELWPYSLRKPPPVKVADNESSSVGEKESLSIKSGNNVDGGVVFAPANREIKSLKDQKIEKLQEMLDLVGKDIQIIEDIADGKIEIKVFKFCFLLM